MGLDMYAYRTKYKPPKEVDFSNEIFAKDDRGELDYETPIVGAKGIAYWRKHPDLHGWMERLYREKGGIEESFNGDLLVLTLEDLDRLEEDILRKNLPKTTGFFFGESGNDISLKDLEFILESRKAIQEGDTVFYDSRW
jgi:hypothetical protein